MVGAAGTRLSMVKVNFNNDIVCVWWTWMVGAAGTRLLIV